MKIINSTIQNDTRKFQVTPFKPPFWLANPHLQTILPKFLAKPSPNYRREIHQDSYAREEIAYDFYDAVEEEVNLSKDAKLDTTLYTNSDSNINGKKQIPLVVLFHGLEGSSSSHYASTLAHQVHGFGWNYVVVHYRSCGGMAVKGDIFYNAGDSKEAHYVLTKLSERYENIYALGVSLGGNILAKYMSEYQDKALCKSAVVVSAPLDLSSSAVAMQQGLARYVYTPYLLNPLMKKALKINLSKEEYNSITKSKDVYDFDHAFTAPRHGFHSVNDYYYQSSALPVLKNITKDTLIITAADDPFLGVTATDKDISEAVTLIKTSHGGHIGFLDYQLTGKFKLTWVADTALAFFRISCQSLSINE